MSERTEALLWIFTLLFNGTLLANAVRWRHPPALILMFGATFCFALDGFLTFLLALPP